MALLHPCRRAFSFMLPTRIDSKCFIRDCLNNVSTASSDFCGSFVFKEIPRAYLWPIRTTQSDTDSLGIASSINGQRNR